MPQRNALPPAAPLLAVVVPVRNEADNILPLLAEIDRALAGRDFEVIYVDDGSDDATPQRLAEARAIHPRLRVVRHRFACGQSQAVASGVKAARAPVIATMDGDGQNDPADIPALVDALTAHPPEHWHRLLVAGHRRRRHDDWLRRLSSRVANGVRGRLLKDDVPDSGCGLKVLTRDAFLDLPRFDHMHRFLPALMIRAGAKVVSMPVNHRPRARGTSKYGLWNRLGVGIVDLVGVMWLQRRARNPVVETADEAG